MHRRFPRAAAGPLIPPHPGVRRDASGRTALKKVNRPMSKFWRSLAGIGLSVAGAVVLALPAQAQTNCNASVGPDIIVGDITGPFNYAAAGGYEALSLGTYSCNIG